MRICVRPPGDIMLAGVRVCRGIAVLFAASRDDEDEPEEKNDGSFHFSYT
jgi:hypothetical protein